MSEARRPEASTQGSRSILYGLAEDLEVLVAKREAFLFLQRRMPGVFGDGDRFPQIRQLTALIEGTKTAIGSGNVLECVQAYALTQRAVRELAS